MSVDLRTRSDGPIEMLDPGTFFEHDLILAFEEHARLLEPALRARALAPLTIQVDNDSWTLAVHDARVRIEAGGSGEQGARLHLDREQLTHFALDLVTPVGWWSNGTLDLSGAEVGELLDWWVVLRGALDGQAPYVAGDVTFVAPDGSPLDLSRTFEHDTPPEEMRAFLEEAGFVHISGVFSDDEMAAVSADMDRVAPDFSPGDGRSWWARTEDGTNRLVRMQSFDECSPTVAALMRDDRFTRLGQIPGDGHRWGTLSDIRDNRVEALIKPIGVVEGISDVPWHKDCSLGRHSYDCCALTVGISVTGADAVSGQLRVLPGSHRALMWPSWLRPDNDLPEIDLPTRTGDVTIHLSCTLHMAQAPVHQERRVVYSGFRLPAPDTAAAREARARLSEIVEAAPAAVSQ
jgi:hypothetical protein